MASNKLILLAGVASFFVCTLNLVTIFRHETFAKSFISSNHDEYNLSNRWDNVNGTTNSHSSTNGSDWNLRSAHRRDDSKPKERNTGSQTDTIEMRKGETITRINPIDTHTRIVSTDDETKDQNVKDIDKSKDKIDGKSTDKKKNKEKEINNNEDQNKDKNKNTNKSEGKHMKKEEYINNRQDSTVSIIEPANSTAFSRHEHVAIVTKIHGDHQWGLLEQSICLLHYAYNHKVLYDIVVFSTDPVEEEKIKSVQAMLSPVKFRLVVDNRGLQNEIAALSPARKDYFLKMCNASDDSNLTWWSKCEGNRLAYNWQAEFRSIHLWHHPSMADYKTMLWFDTDGFATKPWDKDPVDYFIKNKGTIMFDHFPKGKSKYWIQKRVFSAFNATICKLELSKETGNLVSELGTEDRCQERGIPNIHGFFHITDLDFYRSKIVTDGLATIHGDCFLCRFPDDQLAVTAPAAVLAPERSWEMRGKGFHLDVFHNFMLDGIDQAKPAGFVKYWKQNGERTHPTAAAACKVTEGG